MYKNLDNLKLVYIPEFGTLKLGICRNLDPSTLIEAPNLRFIDLINFKILNLINI